MEKTLVQPTDVRDWHLATERVDSPTFADVVYQDFYRSFMLAQNDPQQHVRSFELLARVYSQLYSRGEIGSIDALAGELSSRIADWSRPADHKASMVTDKGETVIITKEVAQGGIAGFRPMLGKEMKVLAHTVYRLPDGVAFEGVSDDLREFIVENGKSGNEELVADFAIDLLNADIEYQDKKRVKRAPNFDSHESFFRRWILEKEVDKTSFRHVRDAIAKLLVGWSVIDIDLPSSSLLLPGNVREIVGKDMYLGAKLDELNELWALNHLGQDFYSPLTSQSNEQVIV